MSTGAIALPRTRRANPGRAALLALALAGALAVAILGALVGAESRGGLYQPSEAALAEIPADYLAVYQQAGARYGLDWAILAAIGSVETSHGRSSAPGVRTGVNAFGCCAGPMQFNVRNGPPSTWDTYGVDGNRDGLVNVYDPADAIPAAARLLRANGAPGDYRRAVFAYNHAGWYVEQVLRKAAEYRGALAVSIGPLSGPVSANPLVLLAHPNFSSYNPANTRFDLEHGLVDARVVALLSAVVRQHRIGVSVFKTGHSMFTASGNVSNHYYGRAVDIASVDGKPCDGSRFGACGRLAVQLARVDGPLRVTELIYCFDPDPGSADNWAARDHCDHIHAGYEAVP